MLTVEQMLLLEMVEIKGSKYWTLDINRFLNTNNLSFSAGCIFKQNNRKTFFAKKTPKSKQNVPHHSTNCAKNPIHN